MTNKLQEICAKKAETVALQKAQQPLAEIEALAKDALPTRGFANSLVAKKEAGKAGLICEIKKASPSAGLIRPDFAPPQLARAYQTGGAACLSILTDEPYFQGSVDDLITARLACTLPVLRKDFMVDPWQIVQARAIGADCVLLIMAVLDDGLAAEMHALAANDLGMDVLIEVHDEEEMARALRLPSGLIGINNRNLKTLQIDLETTEKLAPMVPAGRLIVSESGLSSPEDLLRMKQAGVTSFLIGESLMRQQNVADATRELATSW